MFCWRFPPKKTRLRQVCADLQIKVGAETIRGSINEQLRAENLPLLQEAVNRALQAGLSRDVKTRALEVAIDFHDQPYYGKSEQAEGWRVGGEAKNARHENVSGGDGVCHPQRASADIGNQIGDAGRNDQRNALCIYWGK